MTPDQMWAVFALIIGSQIVVIGILGRGFGMSLGFLKVMAGRLQKKGGVRFLMADRCLADINEYLRTGCSQQSAVEQKARIREMITSYVVAVKKI